MKPFTKALLISVLLVQLIAAIFCVIDQVNRNGPGEFGATFGMANFFGGLFILLAGLIGSIRIEWREAGKGIMTAGLVMIVIGTALCSQFLKL